MSDILGLVRGAKRVCFFAHYHQNGVAAGHVLYYLDALRAAGFVVVVTSTAVMSPAEADRLRAHCDELVFRANVGLDFGGWADSLRRFGELECEYLLLANDSVYGPVTDLSDFIDDLVRTPADFYGAVASMDTVPHLQSWFILLRPEAYRSDAFRRVVLQSIDPDTSKREIIGRFELSLTSELEDAGLTWVAAFDRVSALAAKLGYNPSHLLWDRLVSDFHVPFIKIELVRLNPLNIRSVVSVISFVRSYNERLADLITEDLQNRPGSVTLTGLKAWAGMFSAKTYSEYWVESHDFVLRDYISPTGVRGKVNRAAFRAVVALGKTARLPSRAFAAVARRI